MLFFQHRSLGCHACIPGCLTLCNASSCVVDFFLNLELANLYGVARPVVITLNKTQNFYLRKIFQKKLVSEASMQRVVVPQQASFQANVWPVFPLPEASFNGIRPHALETIENLVEGANPLVLGPIETEIIRLPWLRKMKLISIKQS